MYIMYIFLFILIQISILIEYVQTFYVYSIFLYRLCEMEFIFYLFSFLPL